MTRSGAQASRSIVQRAEALLRSLIGVHQADFVVRPTGGVERVLVVADGGLSNGRITQNIRSALLADLGIVLNPGQIEFITAVPGPVSETPDAPAQLSTPVEGQPFPATTSAAPSKEPPVQPAPATGIGNGFSPGNGHAGPRNGVRAGDGSQFNRAADPARDREDGSRRPPDTAHQPARAARRDPRQFVLAGSPSSAPGRAASAAAMPAAGLTPDASSADDIAIGARCVHLERVEIIRQAGRVRCRVVLSAGADRYSAVADSAEGPLADLQLAARVTCDALRAGELTTTRFEAATVAHLAGGQHVLVALNGWKAGAAIRRSGSAMIRESAEQAAALAVLHALANS